MGCNGSKNTLAHANAEWSFTGPRGWPTVEALEEASSKGGSERRENVFVRVVSGSSGRRGGTGTRTRSSRDDRSRSRSGRRGSNGSVFRGIWQEEVIERPREETKVHGQQQALCTLLEGVRKQDSEHRHHYHRQARRWGHAGPLRPLPELKFINLPNRDSIAYRQYGGSSQSNALVFLHGNVGNHLLWREVVEHPALSGVPRVVLDLRGSGWSSYKRRVASHSDIAADVRHVIKALRLEQCTLVAHSSGSATAALVAAQNPGLVAALCFVSPVAWNGGSADRPLTLPSGSPVATKTDWMSVSAPASCVMTVDKWKGYFHDASVATLPAGSERWAEVTRSFQQQRNATDMAWADYSFNISPVDSPCSAGTNELANITAPMCIILGAHDTVVHAAEVVRNTQACAGDAVKIAPLLAAGHLPMLECLDDFMSTLLSCLQSTDLELTTPQDIGHSDIITPSDAAAEALSTATA